MTVDAYSGKRTIRSYAKRQGRITKAQRLAIEKLMPVYAIPFTNRPLDFAAVFSDAAPVVLEIGFGMGDATAEIARQMPQYNFLAVEIHTPGVGNLLRLLEVEKLPNVRIIQHDAVEVIHAMITDGSLAGVHIFFPDPWPKRRHHKRRLIQPDFVAALSRKLACDAYLYLTTDWQNYAEQILAVLSAESTLENTAKQFATRASWRPLTKFERRGLLLEHPVWEILFKKK